MPKRKDTSVSIIYLFFYAPLEFSLGIFIHIYILRLVLCPWCCVRFVVGLFPLCLSLKTRWSERCNCRSGDGPTAGLVRREAVLMGMPFSSLYYLDRARKIIPIWIAADAAGTTGAAETAAAAAVVAVDATEECECAEGLVSCSHWIITACPQHRVASGRMFVFVSRKASCNRSKLPSLCIIQNTGGVSKIGRHFVCGILSELVFNVLSSVWIMSGQVLESLT